MPDFQCAVCGNAFSVPQQALDKYPGWKPKYCREHSPKKGAAAAKPADASADSASATSRPSKQSSYGGNGTSKSIEMDYTLAEVLTNFSGGPQSGIFTDGSARPNPGPGGWGAVLVLDGQVVEQRFGKDADTTNNRMELTALINGLQMITAEQEIEIFTDSELCVNTINTWAKAWEKNGWKRKGGPIKNLDLVKELYALSRERPRAVFKWIKAHNGWLWNEYADSLSTAWARTEL